MKLLSSSPAACWANISTKYMSVRSLGFKGSKVSLCFAIILFRNTVMSASTCFNSLKAPKGKWYSSGKMLMRKAGPFTQISRPRAIRFSNVRNSWSLWWKRCPRIIEQMTFDTALLTSGVRSTPAPPDSSFSRSSSVLMVARPWTMQGSKLNFPKPKLRSVVWQNFRCFLQVGP